MAPAGSWDALRAALKAGADSVYFGTGSLDMRSRAAHSFDIQDLKAIADECGGQNVKTYLTLNTLVYDEDMADMRALIDAAKHAGISAVICSDAAAVTAAHKAGIPVHMSTQANISNIEAVRFFSRYADVIVLARELSLDQVQAICEAVEEQDIRGPSGSLVRIEVFVHGALCVSIAGKCYMSLSLYGHSANRGDCFQTCRRAFRVTDQDTGDELVIDNKYVMSPADICTISIIDKLIGAGVSVLKIEGRGRAADYVYTVTRAYREAVDSVFDETYTPDKVSRLKERLRTVYNRGFWEKGYYLGKQLGQWSGAYGSQATEKKTYIGRPVKYFGKPGIALIKIESGYLEPGCTIVCTGPTTGYVRAEVTSMYEHDKPVDRAEKGSSITIPVPEKVRPSDKIFRIDKQE